VGTSLPTPPLVRPASRQTVNRFTALLALIVLVIIPGLLVVLLQRASHDIQLHLGDPIPQLTLRGLDSDSLSFSVFSGRRVALFFFNVTCERCQRELSNLDRLSSLFKDRVAIVAISLSDLRQTKDVLRSDKSTLTTLIDDREEARRAFGIEEVPALILVDGNQTVQQQHFGEESFETLRKNLTAFAGTGH